MPAHRSYHPILRDNARDRVAAFRPGFSLLELVICIVILGVVASITVPIFANSVARSRVTSLANRLAAEISRVRQEADAASATRTIIFGTNVSSFRVVDASDTTIRAVDASAEPYLGRISASNLGGDTRLSFSGFGVPDSGGVITVITGSLACDITVEALTARCQISAPYTPPVVVTPAPEVTGGDSGLVGDTVGGLLDLLDGR